MAATSYWDDIIAYFRTDPELNAWLTQDEADALREISEDDMKVWKKLLEPRAVLYQGFDIKIILKLARIAYTSYTDANNEQKVEIEVMVGGHKKAFKYTNLEKMGKDLYFLFLIFVNHGCSYHKIMAESNQHTKTIMEWLVVKYNIDVARHAANQALGPNAITIPRLTACFPTIFCDIFHAGKARDVVSREAIGVGAGISGAVLCPMFVSCVPYSLITVQNNAHVVFFCVHVLLDDILHERDGSHTPLNMVLSLYKAAYNSIAVPHRSRLRYMERLSLKVMGQNSFVQGILDIIVDCEAKIRASRALDPTLEATMEEVKKIKNLG